MTVGTGFIAYISFHNGWKNRSQAYIPLPLWQIGCTVRGQGDKAGDAQEG